MGVGMKQLRQVTAIIEREGNGYVALCPELDVASQGDTIESARNNLQEAVELFLETADPTEIQRRSHSELFVTRLEVEVELRSPSQFQTTTNFGSGL
jgi:predicted RNase H-like HicB family nuclease